MEPPSGQQRSASLVNIIPVEELKMEEDSCFTIIKGGQQPVGCVNLPVSPQQWYVLRACRLKTKQAPVTLMLLFKLVRPRREQRLSMEISTLSGMKTSICE